MLTTEQIKKIESAYIDIWNNIIYDTILTEEQKEPENIKYIAFEIEEILNKLAATFGLSGMSRPK